jgi:leucyl aminopeptidase
MQVRITSDARRGRDRRARRPVFADKRLDGARAADAALGGALADVLEGEIGQANELAVLVHAKDRPYRASRGRPRRPREVHAVRARKVRGHRGALSRQTQRRDARVRAARSKRAARGRRSAGRRRRRDRRDDRFDDVPHRARQADRARPTSSSSRSRHTTFDGTARSGRRTRHASSAKPSTSRASWRSRPANDMTPTHLREARAEIAPKPASRSTCSTKRDARKGMGSLLGVSRGSDEPATLTVLTSTRRSVEQKKSRARRQGPHLRFRRHLDQAGREHARDEVRHVRRRRRDRAMYAIGKLKPKVNVIGVVPSSENLPGRAR